MQRIEVLTYQPRAEQQGQENKISDEVLGDLLAKIGNDERKVLRLIRGQKANVSNIEVSFAGLMLSFTERHPDISLRQIFGHTTSSSKPVYVEVPSEMRVGMIEVKKRSPILRFRMFKRLLTLTLPARRVDLEKTIEEGDRYLTKHLQELHRHNIITYKSREHDNGYAFYILSPQRPKKEPDRYDGSIILPNQVYAIILANPEEVWTREKVANVLIKENPDKQWKKKSLIDLISGILSQFANTGYLKREGFSKDIQSEITLSEEQKAVLIDVVATIDGFQSLNPKILSEGIKHAKEIASNSQRARDLRLKAKKNSPNVKAVPREENLSTIFSIITKHPNITASQIRNVLGEKYAGATIRSFLRSLEEQEKIQSSTVRGVNHWSVIPE